MRKNTFVLLALICLAFLPPHDYYVTFVKGTVTLKRTGKPVKVGEKLQATDALLLKGPNSRISCISPGLGRFDTSGNKQPGSRSELMTILIGNLLPQTRAYHLSTRGLSFEGYDPKIYFDATETGDSVLLIANQIIPISKNYKLDTRNFFFLQYKRNNTLTTRKVPQNQNGIYFNDQVLSQDIEVSAAEKIKLCYQNDGVSKVIAEFIPVIASREDLLREVVLIKKYAGTNDDKKLSAELAAHICSHYGKIEKEELNELLKGL